MVFSDWRFQSDTCMKSINGHKFYHCTLTHRSLTNTSCSTVWTKKTVDRIYTCKLPWHNGFQIYKNQQSLVHSRYQPQRQSWPKRKLPQYQSCDYQVISPIIMDKSSWDTPWKKTVSLKMQYFLISNFQISMVPSLLLML